MQPPNGTSGTPSATPPAAAGSRLDRWLDAYAARTRGMTASEIRALFAVASRPEVVSLAGGMPNLVGAAARRGRRRRWRAWSPSAARWRCSTAPGRATPRCASGSAT